ncbi:MAG: hypothetical protein NZM65_05275 [Flavobacteriales bacterium]|nr:hypothetical protein [Flavobacteriales bacterium]MDW8410083.1 hypothetical protein [Flavobacteriales bacterium]
MKLPVIKELAESRSLEELIAAEEALTEGRNLPFHVAGEDEGEQLTHILGARWIREEMQRTGCTLTEALRAYGRRVRESIS